MASCTGSTWVVANSNISATISMDVNLQSQNVANNTSTLSYTARVVHKNWTFTGTTRSSAGIARANLTDGTTIFSGAAVPLTSGRGAGSTEFSKSGTFTVTHDSSGKKSIGFNFTVNRGGGNSSGDTWIWENNVTNNGSLTLPNIDRSGGSCTVSATTVNPTSVVLKITSTVACNKIRYSLNNGSTWTEKSLSISTNGSASTTITGLSQKTQYTVKVQVLRSYNNVWSSQGSVTFTTPSAWNPSAPMVGAVKAVAVTPTLLKVSAEVYEQEVEKFDYIEIEFLSSDKAGETYDIHSKVAYFSVKPNTYYEIQVKVYNDYGLSSDIIIVSLTTPRDTATIFVKQNNVWNVAYLFYKQNGTWQPVNTLFQKQNGKWVACPKSWPIIES